MDFNSGQSCSQMGPRWGGPSWAEVGGFAGLGAAQVGPNPYQFCEDRLKISIFVFLSLFSSVFSGF